MVSTLVLSIILAIAVSAFCSLLEAVLYSVSPSQIEMLRKAGYKSADTLAKLRSDIEKPITAILTLNTIAHTVGAAIAGAAAVVVFGDKNLALFSVIFTLAILFLSEILPKTVGVNFAPRLAPYIARPLMVMIILLKPIIWLCQLVTKLIPQQENRDMFSAEELKTIATLSHKSGEIEAHQETVIKNILVLNDKMASDVMTPRTVTFSLDENLTVAQAMETEKQLSSHSRVPLYSKAPDNITGIIMRKDVLLAAAHQKNKLKLSSLRRTVHFVAETAPLNRILVDFFDRQQHLFVVVDEYGSMIGIISMEDILEEIIGREIMDESDETRDMRELARKQKRTPISL
ncbi:MAG: HlyC/CorC family transporter [Desulfobulbaceae bacterium]|uniref:HlyC/CorC family transporter n=1 Tax=Candidatus Desulfatifera sulfidica TaxID=2841691 RepID=A0A8J6TD67_9BACT|nr:HlyC/CorC family transporter [Candidatus Desulfatifera sulfidica]